MTLSGRVAIVTGGSKGIGAAIAQRLAAAGATVIIAARSIVTSADDLPGTAQEVIEKIEARGGIARAIACDVTDAVSRKQLIETVMAEFGRIDILVNNAGRAVLESHDVWEMPDLRGQVEQYIFGPVDLIMHALPHMKAAGQGWIVNLGSGSGLQVKGNDVEPAFGNTLSFYGGVKAMVHRYSMGLANELAVHNIAVNVVSPVTAIATPGTAALGLVRDDNQHIFEAVEHIAEATLALVEGAPTERTGIVALSHVWLDSVQRSTMSLDGSEMFHARV